MSLPPQLHRAIEQKIATCNKQALSKAATKLSENYRAQHAPTGTFMSSEADRLAYISVRMPATFMANTAVFKEVQQRLSNHPIESILDLGAGPGTASWAAAQIFPNCQKFTLIERDNKLIELGKSLANETNNTALQKAQWQQEDLSQIPSLPEHDLVICSYALNELDQQIARHVLQRAWSAARIALIIIEPGTMPGFALIKQFRNDLINNGGHLIAPCPHQSECPIPPNDWCHFSQRVNRSSLHRQLKDGHLGYEDEKFSYIAVSKSPMQSTQARVIRHPQRRPGHTQLQLCTPDGIENRTITRSDKSNWKRVKKTNWGDAWS